MKCFVSVPCGGQLVICALDLGDSAQSGLCTAAAASYAEICKLVPRGEVEERLHTVRDVAAKVASHDAMPCWTLSLIELFQIIVSNKVNKGSKIKERTQNSRTVRLMCCAMSCHTTIPVSLAPACEESPTQVGMLTCIYISTAQTG